MRKILFILGVLLLGVLSCRNNDENVQVVDQKIHLYIDSAGIDMLNSLDTLAYQQFKFNDVYGETENAPVSFINQMREDSLYYFSYTAGAKRILVDAISDNEKIYESKIALKLTTKVNATASYNTYDTLTLKYKNSPEVFKIHQVFYNGGVVNVEKVDGAYQVFIHKNP